MRFNTPPVTLNTSALQTGRPHGGYYALGGGLASWLVHLFIWRAVWRLVWAVWRIPTFGPVIVIMAVLALAVLGFISRRPGWSRRRRKGGIYGYGSGKGPRDW